MKAIHDVFHVSLLEPAKTNTFPGRVTPPPPPTLIDNNLEYEVEDILDSRIRREKLEYLVSWKGFGPEHNSWESEFNLKNSAELVEAYHLKFPNRPRRGKMLRPLRV
jgi:hypothetical protein